MQVNLNCNCPKPQFGMAFRKVSVVDVPSFINYARIDISPIKEKAVRKFIDKQRKNKLLDLKYNAEDDSIMVVDKSDYKSMAPLSVFPNTKRTVLEAKGNGFFAKIRALFDYRMQLPENMYEAGKYVKNFENKYMLPVKPQK